MVKLEMPFGKPSRCQLEQEVQLRLLVVAAAAVGGHGQKEREQGISRSRVPVIGAAVRDSDGDFRASCPLPVA